MYCGLWLTGNGAVLLRRLGRELNARARAFSYPSVRSNIATVRKRSEVLAQQRRHCIWGHSLGGLVILKMFERGGRTATARESCS